MAELIVSTVITNAIEKIMKPHSIGLISSTIDRIMTVNPKKM